MNWTYRRGGKSVAQDLAAIAMLKAGKNVVRGTADGVVVELALGPNDELIEKPRMPVDPNLWSFNASNGTFVNVADPTKKRRAYWPEF